MSANKKRAIIVLFTIAACISLIVYANISDTSKVVKEFLVENARLLSAEMYKLAVQDSLKQPELQNADAIRRVLLTHPYIKNCDFYYTGPNRLTLKIVEKEIIARTQIGSDANYLLSGKGELIEELKGTQAYDLPVLSGLAYKGKYLSSRDSIKISEAIAIVNCFGKTDAALLLEVSEIMEVDENQPAVILRGYVSPFLVSMQGLNKQAVYLQALLKERSVYHNLMSEARYVDMRYCNHIFIGKDNKSEIE